VRVDPGRSGALAMAVVAGVVALVAGVWVFASRPRAAAVRPPAPPLTASARTPTSSASAHPSVSATAVVVDVAGRVAHPGLYRLPAGSRVDDAIRAAGGALTGVDLSTVNLAAPLSDGEQVAIGVPAGPGGAAGGAGAGAGAPSARAGPVDLNTATLEQLETLPGVGPVLAQHILDWRAAHGRFASVAQLDDVPGVGAAKLAALKALVSA